MKVLIFDTETTGIKDPAMVEASWIELGEGVTVSPASRWTQRYDPGKPIECGAMATHGIMDGDLIDKPESICFRLPEDTEYLIGHNIDFDYQVALSCGPQPQPKRICTLALSRSLWPEADSHQLGAMLFMLDRFSARKLFPEFHRSETDTEVCRLVLLHILRMLSPDTWEDLWLESERARIPTVMPYGKHKGLPIKEVPKDYRQWLLKQPDVDPYLVVALSK